MVKYDDGLDELATALANPGRRQIVDRLRSSPATTSELAGLLDVGLPAVTKQLALLERAGLSQPRKSGRVVTHQLDPAALVPFSTWLALRRSFWAGQLDSLGRHLPARP